MLNDQRDTLEISTRNENIGGFIRESGPVVALDTPLPKMMTCLMSNGTTSSGLVAYRNSVYQNKDGNPIEGTIPLIAGEKILLQFTEILSIGTTVPVAELWWGIMAT